MAVPTGLGTTYVNALYDIIGQKKEEYGIKEILKYEPWEIYKFPTIGISWVQAEGLRTDRKYERFEMVADIWIYFGDMSAEKRKTELDDLTWAIAIWILKNQTLGGLSIMTDVRSLLTASVERAQTLLAGRIEAVAWVDKIDVLDVIAGG